MSRWSDPQFRKAAGEVLIDWLLAAVFVGGVVFGFVLVAMLR